MTTTRTLRLALSVCLLAAPLATLAAQAHGDTSGGTGLYVSAAYGVTLPEDRTIDKDTIDDKIKTELGFLGGQVGLGFHLFGFRPELAVGYRQAAIDDSEGRDDSVTSVDVIASVYLDVGLAGPVVPYVGVGVGVSWFSIKRAGADITALPFAFQGAAGIGFVLGDLALTLGYRVRGTTEAKVQNTTEDLLKMGFTHNAEVGLRYSF